MTNLNFQAIDADHYENFPVASIFLPSRLRGAVRSIYAFARAADDIADEGEISPLERLAGLEQFRCQLHELELGKPPVGPIFNDLARTIRQYDLPYAPFHDLLDAFSQDIGKTRYADFGEVMAYCRKSANPIGRLLLKLYGDHDERHQAWSDGICSALQLINFLQDVAIDYKKGRIYLPQDEMTRFGVTERQIAEGRVDALWQQFMKTQIERARRMLTAGAPLGSALKGRIGLETRLIVLGGSRILEKLHASQGDMFQHRPILGLSDWFHMLRHALWPAKKRTAGQGGCGSCGSNSGCGR